MNFDTPVTLTDTHGNKNLSGYNVTEPEPASVVLADGTHGNAWQRYFSDGLWHRGRSKRTWAEMLRERNLILVYDAPVREEKRTVLPYCTYHEVVHYDEGHETGTCQIVLREASR